MADRRVEAASAPPTEMACFDRRWRYLRVQLCLSAGAPPLDGTRFMIALHRSRLSMFGDTGAAERVTLMHFKDATQEAYLRVAQGSVNELWAALTVINVVEKRPCTMRVLSAGMSLASLGVDSHGFLRRMALFAESDRCGSSAIDLGRVRADVGLDGSEYVEIR